MENGILYTLRQEVNRMYGIVKDQLIGQSPENIERHYTLIGKQDALKSVLKYIDSL